MNTESTPAHMCVSSDRPRTLPRWARWALAIGLVVACSVEEARSQTYELRGRIDGHMVEDARAAIQSGVREFTIDSRGGYVLHAGKLAALLILSKSTIAVEAGAQCSSACVWLLMHVPADRRHAEAGAKISLHKAGGGTTVQEAVANGVLIGLGVPQDLLERDGDRVEPRWLSADDLARIGLGPRVKP